MSAVAAWALAGALWAGCLAEGPWWLALVGLGALLLAFPGRSGRSGAGRSGLNRSRAGRSGANPSGTGRSGGGRSGLRLAVAMVALAAVGAGLAGGRTALREGGLLPALAADARPVELGGIVAGEPRPLAPRDGEATNPAWFVVRVTVADGRRIRERAVVRVDDLDAAPAVGERVAATATPRPLGDGGFDDHLRRLHVAARLDAVEFEVVGPAGRLLASTTAVRHRARQAFSGRLDEDRAVLLAGLVVGDPRVRAGDRADRFTAAGLTHLVVVSGRHVALMLAVVLGAAAVAGAGARGRVWIGIAAVAWFAVLVRWQPSVLRAAVMAAVVLGAGLLGRGRDARHVLAMATMLLLLADPALAGQVGFSLSVLATGGVLVVTPWVAERLPGPRTVRLSVAATLGAQAGAAPVLLVWFDGVPLWSIPANVVAVPAAGLAQVLGMVAAVAGQVSVAAGGLLAATAGPFLSVVLWAADTFAAGPRLQAAHLLSPAPLLLAVALLRWRRAPRQAFVAGALVLAMLGWPAVRPPPAVANPTLTVLDVGQGDALLLEVPGAGGAARMLYDGGPDERQVAAALRARGVRRLAAVVMSHPHDDHVAGIAEVMASLDVGALIEGPPTPHAHGEPVPASVDAAREAATATGTRILSVSAGQRFTLGDAGVEVLSPPPAGFPGGGANDHTVVLRVSTAHGRILLTGDAEAAAQQRLLARPEQIRAELLQVPHHGGNTNAEGFLEAVGAEAAFISVGEDNPYGHPAPAVLDELAAVPYARTDRDGTLRYELDGGSARLAAAGPAHDRLVGAAGRDLVGAGGAEPVGRYTAARAGSTADVPVRGAPGAAPAARCRAPPRRAARRRRARRDRRARRRARRRRVAGPADRLAVRFSPRGADP